MNLYAVFKSIFKTKSSVNYQTNSLNNTKNSNFELKNGKLNLLADSLALKFSIDNIYLKSSYLANYGYKNLSYSLALLNLKTFSYGFLYLRSLFVILFIDACLTDDEPL